MACKRLCVCSSTALAIGVLCVAAGCGIIAYLPTFVQNQVTEQAPLRIEADSTELWLNPPYDIHLEVWLYNFTNAQEYFEGTSNIPAFTQHGPYRFKEIQRKEAEFFENDTIKYRSIKTFFPDIEWMSANNISLNEKITTVNVPLVTAYNMLAQSSIPEIARAALRLLLWTLEAKPYVRKSVRELLFEGYEDPVFEAASQYLPEIPKRMGFFYGKNNTDNGLLEVTDGSTDTANVARILSWNGKPNLNWWHSEAANMLNGTDGTIYPPFQTRDSRPEIFVADLCRSMVLEYEKDVTVQGLTALRFRVPRENFELDVSTGQNEGFCQHTDDNYFEGRMPIVQYDGTSGHCLPSGLLNISACQNHAPIVSSLPHFLFTPTFVTDSMQGVDPNSEDPNEYQTIIEIEPTTGAGIHFQQKLQINVAVAPRHGSLWVPAWVKEKVRILSKVTPKIIPVLWLNESASIKPETAQMLKRKLIQPQVLAKDVSYGVIGVGTLVILLAIALFISGNLARSTRDDEHVAIIAKSPEDSFTANGHDNDGVMHQA